ncbi:MAG: hypothetical protein CMF69_10850 [Magnetovibrio sp.]|nr:hypothetical protein [Magnetovibrio sp.]|tara:strand:- start:814 stop:1410 length:597 start_codon:yes stop_codon:yes gene_type:complete
MKQLLTILVVFGALLHTIGDSWGANFQKGLIAYNKKDYATAIREWATLAEQGNTLAQLNLGMMYAKGKGVAQNDSSSVKWFTLAAKRGNAIAQVNLGFMYQYGKGIKKNKEEAVRWYRLAAEQGNIEGQVNLGLMYRSGKGVRQNYILSHMWWSIAAVQGNHDAHERKINIAKKMSPLQIATSEYLARKCVSNNYKGC